MGQVSVLERSHSSRFFDSLTQDYINLGQTVDMATKSLALHLNSILMDNSSRLADFPSLPQLADMTDVSVDNSSTEYSAQELQQEADKVGTLNERQRVVFDNVVAAVESPSSSNSNLFYVDGPGGSGKTYLYNCILGYLRSRGSKCLAVASSGIAACLLMGGRTAHSQFKIPLNIHEMSTCNITAQSNLANDLRQCNLIVFDEVGMVHRHNIEAVDRTLRDICGIDSPFGGKVVLFGGDFRQILPVIPGGSRAQVVASCISRSRLWQHVARFSLLQNMRVGGNDNGSFRDFLLDVGNGSSDTISLPSDMVLSNNTLEGLIEHLNFRENPESVILTVKNSDVQKINDIVSESMEGEARVYFSTDSVVEEEGTNAAFFPTEFLNSLMINGLPTHRLQLKIGHPVMLLRNLDPKRGLCNGTRMIVCAMQDHVLDCKISNGRFAGKRVFIPRISCQSHGDTLPFKLSRRQFPISVCYGMTINKSQGQTIPSLGVYLPEPVFSHGQLYVALSRATSSHAIKVVAKDGICNNVVYRDALLH
jgi:ATP-dependent DNA helicase PIF1